MQSTKDDSGKPKWREKLSLWLLCSPLLLLPVFISFLFFDDINIKLDKKMTCTVAETRVVSGTYSIGSSNGSYTNVLVDSTDCPQLIFAKLPEGVRGTNDLQARLKPGHKYTFVYGYIKIPWDTTEAYSFTEA